MNALNKAVHIYDMTASMLQHPINAGVYCLNVSLCWTVCCLLYCYSDRNTFPTAELSPVPLKSARMRLF